MAKKRTPRASREDTSSRIPHGGTAVSKVVVRFVPKFDDRLVECFDAT